FAGPVYAGLPAAALIAEAALRRGLVGRDADAAPAVRPRRARATVDVAHAGRAADGVDAGAICRAIGRGPALGPRTIVGLADEVHAAIGRGACGVGRAAPMADAVDAGRGRGAVDVVDALTAGRGRRLAVAARAELARPAARCAGTSALAGTVAAPGVRAALVVELTDRGARA